MAALMRIFCSYIERGYVDSIRNNRDFGNFLRKKREKKLAKIYFYGIKSRTNFLVMKSVSSLAKETMASLALATALASAPSAAESKTPSAAPLSASNTSHNICTSDRLISNARSRIFILVE